MIYSDISNFDKNILGSKIFQKPKNQKNEKNEDSNQGFSFDLKQKIKKKKAKQGPKSRISDNIPIQKKIPSKRKSSMNSRSDFSC